MPNLMSVAILLVLAREIFAGALRYYLDQFGIGPAWFLPDLALVLAIAQSTAHNLRHNETRYFYVSALLLAYVLIGALAGHIQGNNVVSIVSAIKMALPLISLLICKPAFLDVPYFRKTALVLMLGCIGGVFYDSLFMTPWTGYSISQFGVEREASREWWIDGARRIAGFGASSAATAAVLLVVVLIVTRGIGNRFVKLVLYAAAIAAIQVTTSRTMMIALAMAAIVDLWPRLFFFKLRPRRIALAGVYLLATFLPIFYSMIVLGSNAVARNRESIIDRIYYTWPTVLENTYQSGWFAFLFGQGFGSIGSPANYSGKYISPISAVDNFMIYMFALFGLLSLLLGVLILFAFMAVPERERNFAFAACMMMATINCEGIGGSILVGLSVAFGIAALRPRARAARGLPPVPAPGLRTFGPPSPAGP